MNGRIRRMVNRHALDAVVDAVMARISLDKSLSTCIAAARNEYDNVRNCIKSIFDDIETDDNINYIGILEWSFVQEIIDRNVKDFPVLLDRGSIIDRFGSHPNIILE